MDSDSSIPRSLYPRFIAFVTVFSTTLLAATWFICATWNHFWKISAMPACEIVLSALTLTFVATTILSRPFSNAWLRLAYRVSAIWIGVLNYCFFAAVALWIFSAAAALLSIQVKPHTMAAAFYGLAVEVSLCGLLVAFWLRITTITVRLPNLPANWRGRSVAFLADMHLGNVRGAGFSRRVLAKLRQLQPEAIFISGDLFDGSKADLDALLEPWRGFSAPSGIYFVTGNHEEFTTRAKYLEAVARVGIRVLNNEKVEMNGLQIVGIHDAETHDPKLFRTLLQGAGLDRNRASILLAHQPANLIIPEEEGISLQLSGHTHGGQIWPWTWVAGRVHGRFNRGLNQLNKMWVLTTTGSGTWGAPMRVGTKSEIVMICLESEGAS